MTEPTDLSIGIGHKGFEWLEIEVEGVAAHGSRPEAGVDAILMMGRVLRELDLMEDRIHLRPETRVARPPVGSRLDHQWRS